MKNMALKNFTWDNNDLITVEYTTSDNKIYIVKITSDPNTSTSSRSKTLTIKSGSLLETLTLTLLGAETEGPITSIKYMHWNIGNFSSGDLSSSTAGAKLKYYTSSQGTLIKYTEINSTWQQDIEDLVDDYQTYLSGNCENPDIIGMCEYEPILLTTAKLNDDYSYVNFLSDGEKTAYKEVVANNPDNSLTDIREYDSYTKIFKDTYPKSYILRGRTATYKADALAAKDNKDNSVTFIPDYSSTYTLDELNFDNSGLAGNAIVGNNKVESILHLERIHVSGSSNSTYHVCDIVLVTLIDGKKIIVAENLTDSVKDAKEYTSLNTKITNYMTLYNTPYAIYSADFNVDYSSLKFKNLSGWTLVFNTNDQFKEYVRSGAHESTERIDNIYVKGFTVVTTKCVFPNLELSTYIDADGYTRTNEYLSDHCAIITELKFD